MLLEVSPPSPDNFADVLSTLKLYAFKKISLPDKSSKFTNLDFARFAKANSLLEVLPHYSLQYHYHRRLDLIIEEFHAYVLSCVKIGIYEVLLVSGTRSQRHNVLSLLELYEPPVGFKIHVAFNPYLPDIISEVARLEQKLRFAEGVFLQIGEDLETLERVLNSLPELNTRQLYGCLLYPTRQFQNRFRFRPWKGVALSSRYLENLVYAHKTFQNYAKFYDRHQITPLLEVQPFNLKYLQTALNTINKRV